MFPLLPFVAGVVTGAVALRLLRTDKTRGSLEKAQDSLRSATVSSLEAIENASARARQRLAAPAPAGDAATAPASTTAAAATRKRTSSKPAARKTAAPKRTPATPGGAES